MCIIHNFLFEISNKEAIFVEILNFTNMFSCVESNTLIHSDTIKSRKLPSQYRSLFIILVSVLNKKAGSIIEDIFQDILKGNVPARSLSSCVFDSYHTLLSCLTTLENDDKCFSIYDTIVVLLSQIIFIQNQSDRIIHDFWKGLKVRPSLASRLGIVSFNIGASLNSLKKYDRAICFFQESIDFYLLSNNYDSKRDLKSWQGIVQSLYKMGDYAACQTECLSCLQKHYTFFLSENEKLESFVAYYIHSSLKINSYAPICEKLDLVWDDIIPMELACLSVAEDSYNQRVLLLEYAISQQHTSLLTKCEYLLTQSELDTQKCESLCKETLELCDQFKVIL